MRYADLSNPRGGNITAHPLRLDKEHQTKNITGNMRVCAPYMQDTTITLQLLQCHPGGDYAQYPLEKIRKEERVRHKPGQQEQHTHHKNCLRWFRELAEGGKGPLDK